MKHCRRYLFLLLLLLFLFIAGCSVSSMYRQLDWLVPWYVSDYITLDEQQQSELERRLLLQLDWHCSTQMKRYAKWLRSLHDTPDAFSHRKLEQHLDTTRLFWHDLMVRMSGDAATILISASDQQIEELVSKLQKKQEDSEKKYASQSRGERQRQRSDRMVRLLERWLGKLETPQLKRVASWSESLLKFDGVPGRDVRRVYLQHFIYALSQRRDTERFRTLLRKLMIEPEGYWSEKYAEVYQQRKALTVDMLADVAVMMTPVQRAHLEHELSALADEFDSLACNVEPPSDTAK